MKLRTEALVAASILLSARAPAQPDPLQQALLLFREQNYAEALKAFQEAKRTRPPNAQLDDFIGITETRLGQLEAANASYEEAIRLDPKLADAHKNLGY